jgi:hypothetical protein|tara:strand:- start:1886 stop:6865 length:4980 start_codon:yes stop_codon:yes gene_type:complete
MAQEIKNTFLKSKMNKDLDDRILPNGEYRDALNISVGRSEDNDVGALENIIGNDLLSSTNLGGGGLETIGIYASDTNEAIYVFLTNYTDNNPDEPTPAPENTLHYIYSYNSSANQYTKLVEGAFLNFSKTNRVIGINLLEELLFWTDNRNQPRKINITLAIVSTNSVTPISEDTSNSRTPAPTPAPPAVSSSYYTKEHQISVAKYNPYQAIELYTKATVVNAVSGVNDSIYVIGDFVDFYTPYIGATMTSVNNNGTQYLIVESVAVQYDGNTRIKANKVIAPVPVVGELWTLAKSTMTNEDDAVNWPGDPNYLEDVYARFSYRFKYDDNEYSLMAPFTQIAYIPTQKGYWLNGDEDAAYQSTVVQFMKNNVQNIGLVIALPDEIRNLATNYKIQELDILFREAGSLAVKVLESVPISVINNSLNSAVRTNTSNIYTYDYQSRKPYRVLPEAQTVRVYDKVPIRAFSQESAGSRIIYGNYIDKHTPPETLNYNCRISDKLSFGKFTNFVEYPNSTVKRNRNYQIGFVLADKYGRSSPVILSSVDKGVISATEGFFSGSTIYSPYDDADTSTDIKTWFGDAISVTVNSNVQSFLNSTTGTPGLYATEVNYQSSGIGYAVADGSTISSNIYTFSIDPVFQATNKNVPRVGDYLRGEYTDYVEVTDISNPVGTLTYTITTIGQVNQSYLWIEPPTNIPVLRFAYDINDLGWYSYKVVVKQTQQDYYNAYLPGFLNGYPVSKDSNGTPVYPVTDPFVEFPTNELNKTAHVVLLNDNINKIPRDLQEVGPEQRQYRSSVKLYGRVNNFRPSSLSTDTKTKQYFPRTSLSSNATNDVASTIASARDLEFAPDWIFNSVGLYQLNTNPYIARISTSENSTDNPLGVILSEPNAGNTDEVPVLTPMLTIYETEAQESLLDIYWETTTGGLISDLNEDVSTSVGGGAQIQIAGVSLEESDPNGQPITDYFYALSAEGQVLTTSVFSNLRVTNANGNIVDRDFSLQNAAGGSPEEGGARIILENELVFTSVSAQRDVFTFVFTAEIFNALGVSQGTTQQSITGTLQNIDPVINYNGGAIIIRENETLITNGLSGVNGASSSEALGLVWSMEVFPIGSAVPIQPNTIDWVINSTTGEITKPPYGVDLGTYTIKVTLTDASGGEGALTDTLDLNVQVKPALLNSGVVPLSCFANPQVLYSQNSDYSWPQRPVWIEEQIICSSNRYHGSDNYGFREPINGIFYISDNDLSISDFYDWTGLYDEPPTMETNDLTPIAPDNGWPTGVYRIGETSHTQGTLAMSINMTMDPVWDAIAGNWTFDHVLGVKSVEWYYRFAADSLYTATAWAPIPRDADENQSGGNVPGGLFNSPYFAQRFPYHDQYKPFNKSLCDTFGQTPWWATPENSSVFGLFTSGFQPNIENKDPLWCWSTYKEPMFITGVRTSNYKNYPLAISAGRKIEYAIVVEQLTSVSCTGRSQDWFRDVAVGWCTITDLNNSTCVPVEGSNVVVSGNVLEVQRSTEYNGPQGGNIWLETPATEVYPPLYTNIYFGEMISTLFTDVEMTTPYKPASADAQFINYNYKILSQGVGYTNPETGNSLEVGQLQWAASFSSITGAKISYTDQVGSIQTSGKPLVIDGGERNYIYTTATATTIQDKGQYFLQWPPNKPLIPNNGPC